MKRITHTLLHLILWAGLSAHSLPFFAQEAITGVVTDSGTRLPVEFAAVSLTYGKQEKILSYTITDHSGQFRLPDKQFSDSLYISVSLLGYKRVKQPVSRTEHLEIQLEQEVFTLKEVEIRPGRVWGRQDTINYDASAFLSSNDESIKDVLRKLPGVDISELTGKISYNGKEISNFYVEGMELMGGRYSQFNNKLQAQSVDKIQILDNHQPIKVLRDKVLTENVALNIKLKPEFKDRWMGNIEAGAGLNEDETLWKGDANAIQISKSSQSAYFYKGNNEGSDVKPEQTELITNPAPRTDEAALSAFIPQLTMSAPIKEEKLLFNNSHSLSGNRIYKLNEALQLRLNTGYIHDTREQERGSITTYFTENDSVKINEQTSNSLRANALNLQAILENNAENNYLTNRFTANGSVLRGRSHYTGNQNINQTIDTKEADLRNYLQRLWKSEANTFEFYSLLRFRHLPSNLTTDSLSQFLNLNHLFTEQAGSVMRSNDSFTQRYTIGFNAETGNLKNGYSLFAKPFYQWKNARWRATLNLPLTWRSFRNADFSRFLFSPSFSLNYKMNYAWQFNASATYRELAGNTMETYNSPYQSDYRTLHIPNGIISLRKQQHYSLYAEYKEVVSEFFSTLSASITNSRDNRMLERGIDSGTTVWTTHSIPSREKGWNINGNISKGFFDLHLKAALTATLSSNKGKQLSNGILLPYSHTSFKCEPKVSWSPLSGAEIGYEALIQQYETRIGTNKKEPITNLSQKLNLSYTYNNVTASLITEHFHNKISADNTLNVLFSDINLKWRKGRWQIQSTVSNLFNKRQYAYTQYSALESYSSWINIRPREFMASLNYRF